MPWLYLCYGSNMKLSRRLFLQAVMGFVAALPILTEVPALLPVRALEREPQSEPIDLSAGPLSPKRKSWPAYDRNATLVYLQINFGGDLFGDWPEITKSSPRISALEKIAAAQADEFTGRKYGDGGAYEKGMT